MWSTLALVQAISLASAAILPRDVSPWSPLERSALHKRYSSGCGTSGSLSCSSSASGTCCFEAPGGLLVQPQFWDYDPTTGPTDSWTIHGLWPDNCDGTYEESCDSSRAYTGIGTLLTAQGYSSTLTYMNTYWKNNAGTDESLWEHEWAKHGTCLSTLETSCLPSGTAAKAEAVAYFNTAVALHKSLPTYTWLKNAGIVPSSTATYTLSAFTAAIKAGSGVTPAVDCSSGALNQIYYYYHLRGSVVDGAWTLINAPSAGTCGSSFTYPPKDGDSGGGGDGSLPTKAHITGTVGGLLTAGTWSTQTLATMTLSGTVSGFTMTSSKGSCGVSSNVLVCGTGVSSTFTAVTSGSSLLLAYSGVTSWTTTGTPSGTTVYSLTLGTSLAVDTTLTIVST
ncbi:ribonuclease T2 [Flagelloscypha sp. PMI_526]|nr:ribonuclease T2 [Flagelloscypha sp. PMI_526]